MSRYAPQHSDIETGHGPVYMELKSHLSKLSPPWKTPDIRDSWKISTDLRKLFLELVCQDTYFKSANISSVGGEVNVDFYLWHLQSRLESLRPFFEEVLLFPDTPDTGNLDSFLEIFILLWQHARDEKNFTLKTAVEGFQKCQAIISCGDDEKQQDMERQLAFFGFGLLSMLYQPQRALSSAEPFMVEEKPPKFAYCYGVVDCTTASNTDIGSPFADFLLEFGRLIPTTTGHKETDVCSPLLHPAQFNAHFLKFTCKIKIVWCDMLGAHLDFDGETLLIFRFPGFCMLNIPACENTKELETLLHRSISGVSISGYMKEIILSIHLIFGQTRKSRAIFHSEDAFPNTPKPYHDPLLRKLCCENWSFPPSWSIQAKEVYDLKTDFPTLWPKLNKLNAKLEKDTPPGLKQLWRDSRNSYNWFTFWAVIVIGGLGLLFAIIQTALSAAQFYYSLQQNTGTE